ncbi:cyanophycinase [Rhodohalobacter sp.]|uniref:cyanophycinase n=1 Tax=Rhodohalobacter sp. TaxID=1974210 RepID=UPI002ACDF65F|nr:cyanophycinase [Rhodohalobacter sp.]MDZ7755803.1 cyanophycinase [Rhodohalobacter sp.]
MTKPKGTLIAIGGNEKKNFKNLDEEFQSDFGEGVILYDLSMLAGGPESRIEVITSASSIPEEVGNKYLDTFKKLGVENVGILDIRDRKMANSAETLRVIEDSDAVLFSGGDQSKISELIRGTRTYELLNDRYINDEFIIAGTSAGAMVMSDEMITGGRNGNVLKRNDLKMGKGLGLLSGAIIDSHFIRRARFGRLAEAVAVFPDKIGIGLGEDTGIIITEGDCCEIIGNGMVILFDGSELEYNESQNLKKYVPISLSNLRVHVLAPKDKYFISEKRAEIHFNPRNYQNELTA